MLFETSDQMLQCFTVVGNMDIIENSLYTQG